jgi:hypothetical protein
LAASSVKFSEAVRVPATEGVKVRFTVQLAPAATVAPQLDEEIAKSPLFAPDRATEAILSVAVPELVITTD